MKERDLGPFQSLRNKWLSRRDLVRGAAGAALGAGLLRSKLAFASDNQDDSSACVSPNPIPGGIAPFAPLGVFIHHNPLNPKNTLDQISDPSQITDFDGFVGLTHIRGGGTGTDKNTGATARLNFQADMGFSQGTFIATDGQPHRGTFVFV